MEKMENNNIRRNIVDNKKYNKSELIRVVILDKKIPKLDVKQIEPGRGIYFLLKDINKLLSKSILEKRLERMKIDKIYISGLIDNIKEVYNVK